MKDKINRIFWRQCGKLLLQHLFITSVITLFALAAFWWFIEQPVWKELFSVICTLLYFALMMSAARRIAVEDGRSWTEQTPYPAKGFLTSLTVLAVTFFLWLIYRFTWSFLTIDGSIYGIAGTIYNVLFTVWTFPFNGLTRLYMGGMMWYGHFLVYLTPLLSITIGYLLGYKKISLSERIEPFMYEKEKDK